jgi:hypothetical protein
LEILDLFSLSKAYDVFVDIGAADGYYAVGMLHSQMAKKSCGVSPQGKAALLSKKLEKLIIESIEWRFFRS